MKTPEAFAVLRQQSAWFFYEKTVAEYKKIICLSENTEKMDNCVHISTECAAQESEYATNATEKLRAISQKLEELTTAVNDISSQISALRKANNEIVDSVSTLSATSQEISASTTEASSTSNANVEMVNEFTEVIGKILSEIEELKNAAV